MKSIGRYLIAGVFLIMICSCASLRNNIADVPYLQNSREITLDTAAVNFDMHIRPQDALNIFLFSKDEEAVARMNLNERRGMDLGGNLWSNTRSGFYNYLVGLDGTIDYPLVGKIPVVGLTVEQAAAVVREKLLSYFQDDPSFTVTVRISNFYVSVMGEVRNPQTFDVSRPRITLLEALAKAGDLTIYGKRDNVKLLRQLDNGEYEVHEIDLRDARFLNSPYYYLQQRDVVYVEPNAVMAENTKVGTTTRLWVRGASITISLGSLLYRVLR